MSYNTPQQATDYIASHYTSDEALNSPWGTTSVADQQILLNNAYDVINSLPFTGKTYQPNQQGAFPRNCNPAIPTEVGYAEVEQALAMLDPDKRQSNREYSDMLSHGVVAYKVGNFSESLSPSSKTNLRVRYGLISSEAERLLAPWLTGGYRIE